MDNLDHCFCMFQATKTMMATASENELSMSTTKMTDSCTGERGGAVRRVDLIVTPPNQFPFAVLGWTGSKVHVHTDTTLDLFHMSLN